jgi:hypothetical protein
MKEVFANFVPSNYKLQQSRVFCPELLKEIKENDE